MNRLLWITIFVSLCVQAMEEKKESESPTKITPTSSNESLKNTFVIHSSSTLEQQFLNNSSVVISVQEKDRFENLLKDGNVEGINYFLKEKLGKVSNNFPIRSKRSGSANANIEFNQITTIAENNVKGAEQLLTWGGNTGRRGQLVAGLFCILAGGGLGIYHLLQFDDPATDDVGNGFNLVGDASLIATGIYNVKNAIQNTAAYGNYNLAKCLQYLVEHAASSSENDNK